MFQKLVRIRISHQEFLRNMLIFSRIFFFPVLIIPFISLNCHRSLNWQISLLSLKRVTEILRKTIDQSPYFRQIPNFIDFYLSKQQCGFRKGYSPQYYLLVMLEKWKNSIDKGKCFGALLTDLSKAFDCLSHGLLIAKLHAYGFNFPVLKPIRSYLSNRKQRTKFNAM